MRTLKTLWRTPVERLSVAIMLLVIGLLVALLLHNFAIVLLGGICLCGVFAIWYRLGQEETAIYYLKQHHGQYSLDANAPPHLAQAFVRLEKKRRVTIHNSTVILLDSNTPCAYDKFAKHRHNQ